MRSKLWATWIWKVYLSMMLLSVMILVGCSDPYPPDAKIQLEKINKEFGGNLRFTGKAMFFQDKFADAVKTCVAESKKLVDIQNKNDLVLTLKGPEADFFLKEAQSYCNLLDNFENEWSKYKSEKTNLYNLKLDKIKTEFDKKKAQKESVESYIQKEDSALNHTKAEIKKKESDIQTLFSQTKDKINDVIVSQELPIRKFKTIEFSYNYSHRPAETCSNSFKDRATWHAPDGICYYLSLPNAELKGTPAEKIFTDAFKQYMLLRDELGSRSGSSKDTLYAELKIRNDKFEKAKIRAENKFGNISKINSEYRTAENKLKEAQRELDAVGDPSEKQKFSRDYYGRAKEKYKGHLLKYLAAYKNALFKENISELNVKSDQVFKMAGNASYVVIDGDFVDAQPETFLISNHSPKPHGYFFVSLKGEFPDTDCLIIGSDDLVVADSRWSDVLGQVALERINERIEKEGQK